jgi:hypothetical protein
MSLAGCPGKGLGCLDGLNSEPHFHAKHHDDHSSLNSMCLAALLGCTAAAIVSDELCPESIIGSYQNKLYGFNFWVLHGLEWRVQSMRKAAVFALVVAEGLWEWLRIRSLCWFRCLA